ncbi:uncharacterized protein [Montipora foliosa]|uniref:uncharacterized protein n=1 Tax=Montipora foliosa TaxID=591990 RepID=UPI0035F1D68A
MSGGNQGKKNTGEADVLKIEDLTIKDNDNNEEENAKPGTSQQTPEQKGKSTKNNATKSKPKRLFSESKENEKGEWLKENEQGEWLENHPWDHATPVSFSAVEVNKIFPVREKWQTSDRSKRVDLEKIYNNIPEFAEDMNSDMKKKFASNNTTSQTNSRDGDKRSLNQGNEKLKAFSLKDDQYITSSSYNFYLDCEYMLNMYLPSDSKEWFNTKSGNKYITHINQDRKDMRWIFTPSYRRAKIALLDWPEDKIVTKESTIRILVVRPSEFKEYVECCGHKFPIISLPNDEKGAGYARLWIQKIALKLKLEFIWMIDDSLECFYEYHPTQNPPAKNLKKAGDYKSFRRRQFGVVFERLERIVKDGEIAAMSPRATPPGRKTKDPFVCKPPHVAVFLNLKVLKEKEVFFRPELKVCEDMIFGYECNKKGLGVFRDNRIQFQDHSWNFTGARSPSLWEGEGAAAAAAAEQEEEEEEDSYEDYSDNEDGGDD